MMLKGEVSKNILIFFTHESLFFNYMGERKNKNMMIIVYNVQDYFPDN